MYPVLGWINVGIVVILLIPFVILKGVKNKDSFLFKLKKFLSKFHRPLGALLVVSAVVHGYLALHKIALHTGTLVAVAALITMFVGGMFISMKKKPILTLHKVLGMVLVVLLVVHLVVPWLIS
ncbi:MAG: hypothetical protein JXN65_12205 [Clostridia bacterium]|nr:hypothetical protein [Clostridia bacterium]